MATAMSGTLQAGGSQNVTGDLYDFLAAAELQHYYAAFKDDLKVIYVWMVGLVNSVFTPK